MGKRSVATLEKCYTVYKYYESILNSYVSDYYIETHWNKLPESWQKDFDTLAVEDIIEILDFQKSITRKVHPLSLLCLRYLVVNTIIPRKKIIIPIRNHATKDAAFIKYFWKNVKLKKRHEINEMAQICCKSALQTNCFNIVDIGSGVGHLSRMLSYGCGFKVCTFEANFTLCEFAIKLDENLANILNSKKINHKNTFKTVHINKRIELDLPSMGFYKLVKNAFGIPDDKFKFGIVGLHPCGDLGAKLLRLFNECPNVVFINIASCCYMKLTLTSPQIANPHLPFNPGFPLSTYCKRRNFRLTYLSCEIACHAIENYVTKLQDKNNFSKLKIHAYRAALEKIITCTNENLRHSQVSSVKYDEDLSFKKYCNGILKKFDIIPSAQMILLYDDLINKTWKNVVVFYSMRLLLAPLVETIILLDRLLYVEESESYCDILPIFDPNISPRCHVLSAVKSNKL